MKIRRAEEKDLAKVDDLLSQVLEIHASIRPDLFRSGTRKYSDEELLAIFRDDQRPVFVAVDGNDQVLGYLFGIMMEIHHENMQDSKTLYVDDLCVDRKARGMHVGKALMAYAEEYAKQAKCHNMTLHVWHGNDNAIAFYQKEGYGIQQTTMEKILD
jgi:ribosomal protein S18 acetylase RimI-like enzyme